MPFETPSTRISGGGIIKENFEAPAHSMDDVNCRKSLCFGVYRWGHEFVRDAAAAGHPIGKDAMLPLALSKAIHYVSSKSQHEVAIASQSLNRRRESLP